MAYRSFRSDPRPENLPAEPEVAAICADRHVKDEIVETRQRVFRLGPLLRIIREKALYSFHPEMFGSFEEWLAQPDVHITPSLATDLINWSIYADPLIVAAGLGPREVAESLDQAKLRLLVPQIRKAQEKGEPWTGEEFRAKIRTAAGSTVLEMKNDIKPPGRHHPSDDIGPNPTIQFQVTRREDRYEIRAGGLTTEEMLWIQKMLRPIWVDRRTGQVLRLPDPD